MNLRKSLAIAAIALVAYTLHLGTRSSPDPKPGVAPAQALTVRSEAAQYFGEANWDLDAAASEAGTEPSVETPTLLERELMELEGESPEGRAVR